MAGKGDEDPGSETLEAGVIAGAPAAAGGTIGLTCLGAADPALAFAPGPPLETLPVSTTTAAPVDPDFVSEEVSDETDGEAPACAAAVEGAEVAPAPEVEDPPDPTAVAVVAVVAVVPVADVDVAAIAPAELDEEPEAEPVEPDAVEPEAVEPEAVEPEAVEPEAVEPEVAEPEPVVADPVFDAQDAAAVTLPACGDAPVTHWDEAATPDAAPAAESLAPVSSVAPWPTALASVSTVVVASVAQAATPAGTAAAEEHAGAVTDPRALSARARGQSEQSTKLAATNASQHAAFLRRRIDVPAKAPLRRLMSISPSDANVKSQQLAISPNRPRAS